MAGTPPLDPQIERDLVSRVAGGDRAALGELLEAHHLRVYHVCLRMVGHAEDAADLTQETLLRAIHHIATFRSASRFGTWLLRIAMNLCTSHLRKGKVRSAISLDNPRHAVGAGHDHAVFLRDLVASSRELSPEARVENLEEVRRLIGAIDAVEPSLRAILLLRDLQGLGYQDVAEVLGVPVGTVKSRLFRARLALRHALEPRTDAAGNGRPAKGLAKD